MTDLLKILFLVPYPIEGASYRYRVHQFLPYLSHNNIQYTVSSFMCQKFYKIVYKKGHFFKKIYFTFCGFLRRIKDLGSLHKYNIIFIHLESSPFPVSFIEHVAKWFKKKIIYDLDDAIFLKKEGTNKFIRNPFRSHQNIPKLITLSSHTIVCNDYLKTFASQFIDEKKITVIPTSVDTHQFNKNKTHNNEPVIGWIGSHSTFPYLVEILDIFPELSKKYRFVLKIVGAPKKIILPDVQILQKHWMLQDEISDFQSLDIGLYPLPQKEWIKGKTGFKPIQYMSVSVPCVASNVGRAQEFIIHGVNGFLVNSRDEWIDTLSQLLTSKDLREEVGKKGRKTVEEHYSLDIQAPKLIKLLKNV